MNYWPLVSAEDVNPVDTISSSNVGDSQVVEIDYQSLASANSAPTFATQVVTLNGRAKVALSAPCARVWQIRNMGVSVFLGDVYVYENTDIVLGVPTDITKIHGKASIGFSAVIGVL